MLISSRILAGDLIPHSAFRIPNWKRSAFRIPHSAFRKGLSLAEVLIALLVLALGMMGILALYPLGAKQMADAIKDERAAQLADMGEGMMRVYWRSAYLYIDGSSVMPDANVMTANPELGYLDNPIGGWNQPGPSLAAGAPYPANYSGPSSPLLIDPIGYLTSAGTAQQHWVGGVPGVLPRQTVSWINNLPSHQAQTASSIRFCSLLDDMTFNLQGNAIPINRAYRYNAAYLIQRAKNNVRQEANLKVIVYQGRPPSDMPATETYLANPTVTPATDQIALAVAGIPLLRKGTWILLASQQGATEAFADFYRVVGYAQYGGAFNLTVSPPIRAHGVTTATAYAANALILDNVIEVFDRGTLTPFAAPAD